MAAVWKGETYRGRRGISFGALLKLPAGLTAMEDGGYRRWSKDEEANLEILENSESCMWLAGPFPKPCTRHLAVMKGRPSTRELGGGL